MQRPSEKEREILSVVIRYGGIVLAERAKNPETRAILIEIFKEALGEILKPIKEELKRHTELLEEHSRILKEHSRILEEHSKRLESIERRVESLEVGLENLEKRVANIERDVSELKEDVRRIYRLLYEAFTVTGLIVEDEIRELLNAALSELGFKAERFTVDGKDVDVVIHDSKAKAIEIKRSVKLQDVLEFLEKVQKLSESYPQYERKKPLIICLRSLVRSKKALEEVMVFELAELRRIRLVNERVNRFYEELLEHLKDLLERRILFELSSRSNEGRYTQERLPSR